MSETTARTTVPPGDEEFIETEADATWVHGFLLRWEARDPEVFRLVDGGVFHALAKQALTIQAQLPPESGLVSTLLDEVRETWHTLGIAVGLHAWQAGYAAGVAATERKEGGPCAS